ncbi:MAG: Tn3 family transposase [Terracidiphilus sp.]
MRALDEHLTLVSEAEKSALYGLPDFDDFQRAEYFALTTEELALAQQRDGLHGKIACILQIGYFKAKQAFFPFRLADIPGEDIAFLMRRYFPGQAFRPKPVRKEEYYSQRREILRLFGYRFWSREFLPRLEERAGQLVMRDVTPAFILTELIALLRQEKIVRPGYHTVQAVISKALAAERRRLSEVVEKALDRKAKAALQQLLVRQETLSELAQVKQDAKNFGYRMMTLEREKRSALAPLYRAAKEALPKLDISQQNVGHYASLATYYSIYDLRRLKPEQTHLYLLCYSWQRYREFSDNLADAFDFHMKQVEDATKEDAEQRFTTAVKTRQREAPRVGQVLLLYVDEALKDATPFGSVRHQAFAILPKETLLTVGRRMCDKPVSQIDLRWQAVDKLAARFKKHLRPLVTDLEFSSLSTPSPWLAALHWMKKVFARQQPLAQRPLREIPENTIPERLRPHLLEFGADDTPTGLRGDRYEFWIYRQVRKRLEIGELYLDDSIRRRRFSDELVVMEQKEEALKSLDVPWLRQPVDVTLEALTAELHDLWQCFDRELRQGKLEHLNYDPVHKKLSWRKPKLDPEETVQTSFYDKLPARDIADIFRLVNGQCSFLSALTPLQPRYAKKVADEDSLMAVIMAQAMNLGNHGMSETSDISYHSLEAAHQQCLRLSTLKSANDRISNFIAGLAIFPHYSFDLEVLYGSVDGQKFESADPTIKARYSRKYFGRGKGVVAYTLLANHVALQTELIGAHEHESYYVFDICYHNTSEIAPTTITGDMHSVNKANFAIMHWFGRNLAPRFTNLQAQLKHLYCGRNVAEYRDYLIQPAGRIDHQLIAPEKASIDRVVATLGLKEMRQSILVRKLCTLSSHHPTRKAIFEFDKLVRSIYTLRYLRDPRLQRNVHLSQNRIESYHQLRAFIAEVSGKKHLTGRTDLDVAISNECGRLLANVVIAYNSILLSMLLNRHPTAEKDKFLEMLRKISPVAWQHIHFLGHYLFRDNRHPIDLEALLAHAGFD